MAEDYTNIVVGGQPCPYEMIKIRLQEKFQCLRINNFLKIKKIKIIIMAVILWEGEGLRGQPFRKKELFFTPKNPAAIKVEEGRLWPFYGFP